MSIENSTPAAPEGCSTAESKPPQGINLLAHRVLQAIERIGLLLLLLATLAAFGGELWHVFIDKGGKVSLADLLLLFIYLEVVAMIGIYFESHRLPVRFVLYIAVVALSRHIVLDMKGMHWADLLASSAAILLVVLSVLLVRLRHPSLASCDD